MKPLWRYGALVLLAVLLGNLALPAAAQKPAPAKASGLNATNATPPALAPRADTSGELAIGNEGSYALSRSFSYLEDAGGELALADLLKPDARSRFQPVPQTGSATNFGLTRSAIWLRVTLRTAPGAPADWMLELAYPPLDRLELYAPDGNLRPLDDIEADVIRLAIGHYRGRMTEVARRLGIGRSTLYRKLSDLGIDNVA
jgi:uncharacterized membrane protein